MHYLVYNSTAGRGRMPDALTVVQGFFERHDLPLTVMPPVKGPELTRLLLDLPADARLLSLGGDGTLNGLLDAACNTGRSVGVLPAGSADDFASALGFPRDTLEPALQAILAGRTRLVDTARARLTLQDGALIDSRFVNALGSGFDAEVARQRELRFNWLRGASGYYVALALGWLRMHREPLVVRQGDQEVYSGRSLLLSCQNSPRTGGSFNYAPGAQIDDGMMDMVVAGNLSHIKLLRLLPKVLATAPWADDQVLRVTGQEFSLEWTSARTVHMDGEIHPPAKQVSVQVLPGSLRVFVP